MCKRIGVVAQGLDKQRASGRGCRFRLQHGGAGKQIGDDHVERGVGFWRELTVCDQVADVFLNGRREPLGFGEGESAGGLCEHRGCDRITDPLHAGAQRQVGFPAFALVERERRLGVVAVVVPCGVLTL